MVQYYDELIYSGDASTNKEFKFVIFSNDGRNKVLMKYIRSGLWDQTYFGKSFWLNGTFYFNINYDLIKDKWDKSDDPKFYSLDIIDKNFNSEDIFHSNLDILSKRDVTDMNATQIITFCKSENSKQKFPFHTDTYHIKEFFADCVTAVAIGENNANVCEEISREDAKVENSDRNFKDDCYNLFAETANNPDLCTGANEIQVEWCKQKSIIDKTRINPQLCDQFEDNVRDTCYKDAAIFLNNAGLCDKIVNKFGAFSTNDCYMEIEKNSSDK